MKTRIVSLAVTFVLFFSCTLNAGPGRWTGGTPYGGGGSTARTEVHVTNASPNILYLSDILGLYKSIDGGLNWTAINNGLGQRNIQSLAIDQESAGHLYVLVAGTIFRSIDAGNTWSLTYTPPADEYIAFIVDVPGSSGQLIASYYSPSMGLRRSVDGGRTFTPISSLTGFTVHNVVFDPTDNTKALAGVTGGASRVYQSSDAGASWTPIATIADIEAGAVVTGFSFGAGSRVYASTSNRRFWKSDDNGNSWSATATDTRAPNWPASVLFAHPSIGDTIYFAGPSGGILVSNDAGVTSSALSFGLAPNPSFSAAYASIGSIAAHPSFTSNNTFFVASSGGGFYRSTDAGTNWTNHNTGLTLSFIRALAIHPNPGTTLARIYAGVSDYSTPTPALHLSVDGASTWSIYSDGLGAASLRSILIDPTTTATISGTHMFAGGTYYNSSIPPLYKSTDGGAHWAAAVGGLPTQLDRVRSLAFDPRSCAMPPTSGVCTTGPLQTIYATTNGKLNFPTPGRHTYRVIKSTDAGLNWTPLDGDLPGYVSDPELNLFENVTPVPIVVNPQNPNVMYLGTYVNYSTIVGAPTPTIRSGVFKTTDGGLSWNQRSTGLPRVTGSTTTTHDVLSLVMHPTNPNILWASTVSSVLSRPFPDGSIYKTIDGGLNWTRSDSGLTARSDIRALIVDPADSTGNTLYASGGGSGTDSGAVYKSSDGGSTWRSMSIGLPSRSALAIAIDPNDRDTLYAGTSNGVWSFTQIADSDADGIADSVEDAVVAGGDGNGDSVRDAEQSDVGSTALLSSGVGSSPTAGCDGYFTAEVQSLSCAKSSDVQAISQPLFSLIDYVAGTNLAYEYPLNLVSFELPGCAQASVELTFHGAGEQLSCPLFDDYRWSFRFYGPQTPGDENSVKWYDFSDRATRLSTNKWRLSLDANQFGSYRPINDSILFIGGPALNPDRLFRDSYEN